MVEDQKGLYVRDLLIRTYEKLSQKHENREIILSNGILAEIADDSDWHRTRKGYMDYVNVRAFQFNDKTSWVVARGEKYGDYPANIYDSDIMALEFPLEEEITDSTKEELIREIIRSSYFRNSLISGMADGSLAINKEGRFKKQLSDLLRPRIQEFTTQEIEYDVKVLSLSTLSPFCKKSAKYKPEFADFIAESIEVVLKSQ
jgi:hypothetical protein